MTLKLWIIALLTATTIGQPSIEVRPNMVMAGAATYVTCRVPPLDANRELTMGLAGYQASTRQLDGLNAPITFRMMFSHVPCGVEKAFCRVQTNTGGVTLIEANVKVAGCEDGQ